MYSAKAKGEGGYWKKSLSKISHKKESFRKGSYNSSSKSYHSMGCNREHALPRPYPIGMVAVSTLQKIGLKQTQKQKKGEFAGDISTC